jgi:hypothetical protein
VADDEMKDPITVLKKNYGLEEMSVNHGGEIFSPSFS